MKKANTETKPQYVKIEDCAKGEFIKRKEDAKTVYVRGDYDRASKSYSLTDTNDMNREIFIKRGKMVFIGFEY